LYALNNLWKQKGIILLALLFWWIPSNTQLLITDPFISESSIAFSYFSLFLLFVSQWNKMSALPLAKNLKTYLRLPSYQKYLGTIPEMRKNIKDLCGVCLGKRLSNKNRRLVFFIDDLDRCGVDGIVKTFEAVHLVLDIPWVTVVIAVDQHIVLPALASHYEKLSKYHESDPIKIARDYLAKVIHLPVELSTPDNDAVANYLAEIWNDTEFVEKARNEQSQQMNIEPTSFDNEPAPSKTEIEVVAHESEANIKRPEESLQDIIEDLNNLRGVSVKSILHAETNITSNQGFGDEQKMKFYQDLIKFNLRNPRQIKRLYNSYNLLWSIYAAEWEKHEGAWRVYMLALLTVEMFNDYESETSSEHYLQVFFSLDISIKKLCIEGVDWLDIDRAHNKLYSYQIDSGVNLLARIKPFVLAPIKK